MIDFFSLFHPRLRFKGHEVITRINRYERGCCSTVILVEEGDEHIIHTKIEEMGCNLSQGAERDADEDWYELEEKVSWKRYIHERQFWDYFCDFSEVREIGNRGEEVLNDTLFCNTLIDSKTRKPSLKTLKKSSDAGILLSRSMLEPSSTYVMDAETEIFVWIGRKSSSLQRQIARAVAKKFHRSQPRQDSSLRKM